MSAVLAPEDPLGMKLSVGLQRLPHGADLPLPSYGTPFSAGFDLYAAIEEDIILAPGAWKIIPTGIAIALPTGYEAQIRSRSGLAAKHGVVVLNAPGTIDADYRGEILGIMINHGREPFTMTRGMRFAQMVIAPVTSIAWNEHQALDETSRGDGRFGSTGIR
ncbi:MAG: deoxyuridine 5-triphosphate nucleotidohydrolase [Alphaproteobacteria bacterium]|jgi:dUTP pyrophosphatase|nr:deoxyuridine 5-triphosphate nucleotidohydrolase [Alphaproteobacteria bacterium]